MSVAPLVPPQTLADQIDRCYVQHRGWLHGWLSRRVGCTHRAADLVHDTFLRLLVRQEKIIIEEPRALLATVARRVLSNHRRREQIEQAYLDVLALAPEAAAPSPEEREVLLEALVRIDAMLDGLPVAMKRAFLHSQLDGMTHAQIAAALKISVATVKRYLVKAGAHCYFAITVE